MSRYVELVCRGRDPLLVRVVDEARWEATLAYLHDCGIPFATFKAEPGADAVDDDAASDLIAGRDL